MADLSSLKSRSKLGAPPRPEEASQNITAPEVAPAPLAKPSAIAPAADEPDNIKPRRDMRSARRTNRTLPFSTKVSPEFDERIRDIAFRDNLMLCELLEKALAAYEREQATSRVAG
jgi:hypothetical protein